jgi:transcriptional activator HAC1
MSLEDEKPMSSLFPNDDNVALDDGALTPSSMDDFDESNNSTPAPDKKPTKKRKSWGQELPTPTTNLPPRYETLH